MLIAFYAAYRDRRPKRIEYASSRSKGPAKTLPNGFFMHGFSRRTRAWRRTAVSLPGAASYRLVEVYPYSGLSGFTWMLYRRDAK